MAGSNECLLFNPVLDVSLSGTKRGPLLYYLALMNRHVRAPGYFILTTSRSADDDEKKAREDRSKPCLYA